MAKPGGNSSMAETLKGNISVDAEKCTGCRICQLLCSMVHFRGKTNPRLARIRVEINRRPPPDASPASIDVPHVCRQCDPAPCAEACMSGAFEKDEDKGIWTIYEEICNGCGACMDACPYGMIVMHNETAMKCDLCGGDYTCVSYCPRGALAVV
jgi:Fe-S-cluster-containing hydrogenase component 2